MHNIKTSFVSLAVNRRMIADQSLILWQPVADWFLNFNDDSKFSRRPIAEWLAIGRRLVCNWSATDFRSTIWSVIGCRWSSVVIGRRLVVAIMWPSLKTRDKHDCINVSEGIKISVTRESMISINKFSLILFLMYKSCSAPRATCKNEWHNVLFWSPLAMDSYHHQQLAPFLRSRKFASFRVFGKDEKFTTNGSYISAAIWNWISSINLPLDFHFVNWP